MGDGSRFSRRRYVQRRAVPANLIRLCAIFLPCAQAPPQLRVTLSACGYLPRVWGRGASVRAGVLATTALSLCLSVLAAAPGQAQTPPPTPAPQAPPPLPGFMPAFEITRIVRASGFDPLAPPLREGTNYVVRATDFRGILMRVVVDARSGAIRAVNRIVPGPGPYGQFGMVTPPYGVAPAYPPYGAVRAYPPDVVVPALMPEDEITAAPPPSAPLTPPLPAAILRPGAHPLASTPPLPRPRPAELASHKAADDAKSDAKPDAKPDAKSAARPDLTPAGRPDVKSGTAVSGSAAAPAAPNKLPPATVPIND